MLKRLYIIALILMGISSPGLAADDQGTSLDQAPAAVVNPANSLTSPQGQPSGGSNADVGSLQPAGSNVLQSSTDSVLGLGGPASSNQLQAGPASPEDLQVITGDIDPSPKSDENDDQLNFAWIISSLIVAGACSWFGS